VLHGDYSLVTAQNPAQVGETVSVYLTGLGTTNPVIRTARPAGQQPDEQHHRGLHRRSSGDRRLLRPGASIGRAVSDQRDRAERRYRGRQHPGDRGAGLGRSRGPDSGGKRHHWRPPRRPSPPCAKGRSHRPPCAGRCRTGAYKSNASLMASTSAFRTCTWIFHERRCGALVKRNGRGASRAFPTRGWRHRKKSCQLRSAERCGFCLAN
jgi:hypothetical protein